LKWGFRLFLSLRGVTWTHEPKAFRPPAAQGTARTSFLLQQLGEVAYCFLLWDLATIYNRQSPGYNSASGVTLASRHYLWRVADLAGFATSAYAQMCIFHGIQSIISVTIGFSEPQDWVKSFGFWGDAYTLRRFWGYVISLEYWTFSYSFLDGFGINLFVG
jgi:hypothetical protein